MYLVERLIFVPDICGFLCCRDVRIGRKLSCCGGSDWEDENGVQLFFLRLSRFFYIS